MFAVDVLSVAFVSLGFFLCKMGIFPEPASWDSCEI